MMRRMSLVLLPLMLSSCMHARFVTGRPMGELRVVDVPYFLYGVIGSPVIDTKKLCPNGVALIDVYRGGLDGFLGFMTLGIFTPKTVQVVCAGGAPVNAPVAQPAQGSPATQGPPPASPPPAAVQPPAATPPPAVAPPPAATPPAAASPGLARRGALDSLSAIPRRWTLSVDAHDRVIAAVAQLHDERLFVVNAAGAREVRP